LSEIKEQANFNRFQLYAKLIEKQVRDITETLREAIYYITDNEIIPDSNFKRLLDGFSDSIG
jgi:hypothetical protein